MKILKILGIAIAVLAILVVSFLAYLGFFAKYTVSEISTGPYLMAYESFIGPYPETGKIFDKVYKSLKADGIKTKRGLGIYYDDPAKVPAEKLRSDCGVIIENPDQNLFATIKNKYNVKQIVKAKRMVVEFPKKNMLSYFIGPMKVYPLFEKHAKAQGYSASTLGIEIYDENNKKIIFMMDINT